MTSMLPGRTGRRMSTSRIVCGVIWGVIAVITLVGGVAELTIGVAGGAVVCFIVAAGSAWYDFRVWTFRARGCGSSDPPVSSWRSSRPGPRGKVHQLITAGWI